MKDFSSKQGAAGFSFIELMIAMAILAMGMLAAVSMHVGSSRNNTKGNIYTQANMLAKAQLETLKSQDVLSLAVGGPYTDPNNPVDAEGQPGGMYNRSWTIETLGTDARRLTVTVQWNRLGKASSVVVASNTKGGGV
ncbi:MAG TPA: prepilin-type N-terminal cleavage/methylation domain-containing protein [Phycisphaerae bacterium]|nr:prepilin-type N-terminal cleavage/methylation domain-containing protein [Phycisphaerae bacterium]